MAQILAPSVQWQMKFGKNSADSSLLNTKMLSSLVLKQNKKVAVETSTRCKVYATLSENGSTINRLEQLLNLDVMPYTDKIIAEHTWIGGSGIDPIEHPFELPKWNYDGSSTGQAPGEDSEVIQGVANRGCSIRVGCDTEKNGKGYLEDRRPASNMDPYTMTALLAETTILWEPTQEAEALAAQSSH